MRSWIPWRFAVRYVTRAHGFLDPIPVLARLRKFSQPSEIDEPIELLRAGVVFHARGLLNSKVIQHNLDWVWPYWIERQYNPHDICYLPRAFSITQINLTNRNWSCVGIPGHEELPIIDPRGLLTPFWDGWSLDTWLIGDSGQKLLPSKTLQCQQRQTTQNGLTVETECNENNMTLKNCVWLELSGDSINCVMSCEVTAPEDGWLVISVRPYNPEGISLIDYLKLDNERRQWSINKNSVVNFDQPIDRHQSSDYHNSDVFMHLMNKEETTSQQCNVGMVTAAAMFRVKNATPTKVTARIPLKKYRSADTRIDEAATWSRALKNKSILICPDIKWNKLYEAAVQTLILCTPDEVFAGPYTYKRYWYRDTVFIAHGLLCAGLVNRVEHIINQFPSRQKSNGYYHSQDGEWDSNGQVLWLINQYHLKTGLMPSDAVWLSAKKAAEWIIKKRLPDNLNKPWQGLMPAGFSAEHLGPNDHFYWDNFWSIAGLESIANLAFTLGDANLAKRYTEEAKKYRVAVDVSLHLWAETYNTRALPASPTRRMDAGAIGSVVAGYPLHLFAPENAELSGTLEFLLQSCLYKNGFFQDMIHSGVNAYLTLHIAQSLLRKNDPRYLPLVQSVAAHASATGHWPEAVHPHTDGGCMGDGQHTWAAAEWVAMMRNCFVREEANQLILLSGIPAAWLQQESDISFGPTPTEFGSVSLNVKNDTESSAFCNVELDAHWRGNPPDIVIRLSGTKPVSLGRNTYSIRIKKPTC